MPKVITDADYAERMLRAALGGEPELSDPQIADLMTLATSQSEDGADVFAEYDLNRAASVGWDWKSSLTADQYDLGGGAGKTLDRSQWNDHCERRSELYASGQRSVLGAPGVAGGKRKGGIGVIGLTSSIARDSEVL